MTDTFILHVQTDQEHGYYWRLLDPAKDVSSEGVSPSVSSALQEASENLPPVAIQFWWDGHCLGTIPSAIAFDQSEDFASQFTASRAMLRQAGSH
jgi:hypothetical protein